MSKSLKRIALIVSLGTLLSKTGGLARQLVIAAAFGVGAAYDAFNYAYVIPGFLFVMLGGINGPFHSAMVSVLSRRTREESAEILTSINTIVSLLLGAITGILIIFANQLINIVGPGLSPQLHQIAVIQLQLMAPMALLGGLIGLGFGSLNAADQFWIPSISPLMTSMSLITGVAILWAQLGTDIGTNQFAIKGGIVLAASTLIGALLQWAAQIPALINNKLAKIKFSFNWRHPGVREVWKVMAPATLSSGMLQINVFTDLFFASGIYSAAAGLSYATLLVQTPLGLISNALLVPLLPVLSRLREEGKRSVLISRVRQGLLLSVASMVALGAIFIALSTPIVALIFERGAFDSQAAKLVSGLLIAYGVGMPVYLTRDLLVRVFYSLGDGQTPFAISGIGIFLNIFLDWIFIGGPSPWGSQIPFNFGANGLVLATAGVNLFTCLALLIQLDKRLNGLPVKDWCIEIIKIICAGIFSGLSAWILESIVHWPDNSLGLFFEIAISSSVSLLVFGLLGTLMKVKEIEELIKMISFPPLFSSK